MGSSVFQPDKQVNWKTICFGREATPGVGDCTESDGRMHVSDDNGDGRLALRPGNNP